ncbi:hypothetical protein FRC17_007782 [Serendipita sp. 399]|nr:hypothetical protein FRC17_007782 [Serendipita sp. 399]
MSDCVPRVSDAFPQGNGTDILLISTIDSTNFYFYQFLLSHTSPVLRNMIQSGGVVGAPPPYTLHLYEDSVTLDLLLQHLDPTRVTPPMHANTVFKVLEASKKYEIKTISQWFSNQITNASESDRGAVDELIRSQPMRLLRVGEELNLPQVAQVALRQLVKANESALYDENAEFISQKMWRHLTQLRMERSKFVSEVLLKFLLKVLEAQECGEDRHRRTCFINDQIRELIVYVGIMTTQGPSWETFERLVNSMDDQFPCVLCKSVTNIIKTSKPLLIDKQFSHDDGVIYNIYTDKLLRRIQPVEIPASTLVQPSHPLVYPCLLPVYDDIKKSIQTKESELPQLPAQPPPPVSSFAKPTNPFASI